MITSVQIITRGTTVQFSTTFLDVNGNVTHPDSAWVNIEYFDVTQTQQSAVVQMTAPTAPATNWTALWDTRGISAPQLVSWSIHTGTADPIPVAVADGSFMLTANSANLPSF